MAGHLRNINAQVSCTMSQARQLLKQFETLETAEDLDELVGDIRKLVNESRELIAILKVAGFTISGPLGRRHFQLGNHTEGSGLMNLLERLWGEDVADENETP